MKIICSKCNTTYKIKENIVAQAKKMTVKCKKCGGRMVLETTCASTTQAASNPGDG